MRLSVTARAYFLRLAFLPAGKMSSSPGIQARAGATLTPAIAIAGSGAVAVRFTGAVHAGRGAGASSDRLSASDGAATGAGAGAAKAGIAGAGAEAGAGAGISDRRAAERAAARSSSACGGSPGTQPLKARSSWLSEDHAGAVGAAASYEGAEASWAGPAIS